MVARGRIHLSPQAAEHLEFAKDIHRRDILSARGTSTTALILSSSLEFSADAHWTIVERLGTKLGYSLAEYLT